MHKVLLYGIRDSMYELFNNLKCGTINISDPNTMGYYDVKILPEPYTLLEKNILQASHEGK